MPMLRPPAAPALLLASMMATPPASEVICDASTASIVTPPAELSKELFEDTNASIVPAMVLLVPAPAPAKAPDVRIPVLPARDPPIAKASIVVEEAAFTTIAVWLVRSEFSIKAFTKLWSCPISFVAMDAPTDSEPAAPLPLLANPTAKPPASARILEASSAETVILPASAWMPLVVVSSFASLINASVVLLIVLVTPAPAPLKAALVDTWELEAETAAPMAIASIR